MSFRGASAQGDIENLFSGDWLRCSFETRRKPSEIAVTNLVAVESGLSAH
jgi:hypothetical protein